MKQSMDAAPMRYRLPEVLIWRDAEILNVLEAYSVVAKTEGLLRLDLISRAVKDHRSPARFLHLDVVQTVKPLPCPKRELVVELIVFLLNSDAAQMETQLPRVLTTKVVYLKAFCVSMTDRMKLNLRTYWGKGTGQFKQVRYCIKLRNLFDFQGHRKVGCSWALSELWALIKREFRVWMQIFSVWMLFGRKDVSQRTIILWMSRILPPLSTRMLSRCPFNLYTCQLIYVLFRRNNSSSRTSSRRLWMPILPVIFKHLLNN